MSEGKAPLPPKVALITGATGGIGRATSIALAAEGYTLALHYHSASKDVREQLAEAITQARRTSSSPSAPSAETVFFQADLGAPDAAENLYTAVEARLGAAAVLILNAGATQGLSGVKSITEVSAAAFEQTWRVNTLAPYALARLAVPAMERAGWGRLVFTSSVAGMTGGVVGPHYASSKSALHGLVHWLAGSVARAGVTVNAVAPALIEDTAMLPGSAGALAARIPVGRLGRPEEIASTIVWMVNNGYVTNKVIAVDGGIAIQ